MGIFGRGKKRKLIDQQLERRGLLKFWWPTADAAVAHCEGGNPLEPLSTGAGPMPARSIVVLLGLEPFVEGGVDWTVMDELATPEGAFYPPNNDMPMPKAETGKILLQEWFFPTADKDDFERRFREAAQ